jgi:hypothetical protein
MNVSFVAAAALLGSISLSGCALPRDPYQPPETHGGSSIMWRIAAPRDIPRLCSHADDPNVAGCALVAGPTFCVITTPPPNVDDPGVLAILQHEVAHCQGWRHPAWPGGMTC